MSEIERAIERTEEAIRANQSSDGWLYDEKYAKTVLSALRAELDREKNPLTWNERINQMTVEEKAKWLYDLDVCRVSSISIDECNSYRHCTECMRNMLNSPYTEGEAT